MRYHRVGAARGWQTVAHRGRRNADDRLAAELAAGKTVRDAAGAAGVGERTAHRRLAEPVFKMRVAELRGEMVAAAAGRLADGMGEAAAVLRGLLGSADEHVRHKAAAKLIELGLKVVELAELERRVSELEQRHPTGRTE
jgi:hypothetical protein